MKTVNFSRVDKAKFSKTLNKRVNNYFKQNNLKKTGNWRLHIKAVIMTLVYFIPFVLLLTVMMPSWLQLILVVVIGIGQAGLGMNVMHDGIHESFSNKKWVNKLMGSSIYLIGGNVYNWQVQHNVLHHTFTNIEGVDEDIDTAGITRFSKHLKWKPIHTLQKYYSIFIYGFLMLHWAFRKDFTQMADYLKRGLSYGKFPNPAVEWIKLIVTKIMYFTLWLGLPILIMDMAWWKVVIGFFIMHYVAGILLSIIFQLAHIVPNTEMPLPDKEGNLEYTWAIHQLYTTSNYARRNWFITSYTGGLNYQIEHHLFPNISHIHYSKIAPIVKQTAKEFNLPYHEYKNIGRAILDHFNHLGVLGKKPTELNLELF